ncbi:MAG: SAM-dependent methyltransferase [Bdellovibrionales bacterium]|nr:SAM-dependent methyltransferase [Bdellovibrionales bacterium]
MNFKSHALSLAEFIGLYTPIWKREIMNEYPNTLGDYPLDWIDLLDSLTEQELFDVDCKRPVEKIKGTSFEAFVQTIKKLTEVDFIPETPEYPLEAWAFHGIKKKKHHEIQKIVPVLKRIRDDLKFDYVVDIGGGVGHLSRVLSHYHQIPSISIDQNSEFQKIGKERLNKFRKLAGAADVTFMNLTFGKDEDSSELKKVFHDRSISLGLHTCGGLSNILIKATVDYKTMGLLNFGCCYLKMDTIKDFPLSEFYKENNLPTFNLYSLTLATRAHGETTFETYQTKERVKSYRYALHLFLMKHFNRNDLTDVGECLISTYWKPFHFYISEKLAHLKITHNFSDEYFNEFYNDPKLQRELRVMYICNIVRWQLGRALEVYLQIDRCLYLEEHDYDVSLNQYFNEALSPRNLGILAQKRPT